MGVAETLRAQAKDRIVARGMAGLAEGHQPHVLDGGPAQACMGTDHQGDHRQVYSRTEHSMYATA